MHKFKHILAMTEDEIIDYHDQHMSNYSYSGDFFINEYYRRQQEKSTNIIEKMNKQMVDYTKIITLLTIINTIFVLITLFK